VSHSTRDGSTDSTNDYLDVGQIDAGRLGIEYRPIRVSRGPRQTVGSWLRRARLAQRPKRRQRRRPATLRRLQHREPRCNVGARRAGRFALGSVIAAGCEYLASLTCVRANHMHCFTRSYNRIELLCGNRRSEAGALERHHDEWSAHEPQQWSAKPVAGLASWTIPSPNWLAARASAPYLKRSAGAFRRSPRLGGL